jgi:hypothetical protein
VHGGLAVSVPVSATMTSATRVLMPGIVVISFRNPRKGSITISIRAVTSLLA